MATDVITPIEDFFMQSSMGAEWRMTFGEEGSFTSRRSSETLTLIEMSYVDSRLRVVKCGVEGRIVSTKIGRRLREED